jgi:alanine-glyoxylate transaminase / serine-glyoxylate transaminase / serine-pyruvate transaminase
VPDAVLRAIGQPTIDHRGAAFATIARSVLADVRPLFGTSGPVALYPGSGTGGWEAALVNTLNPGDRVLICETGFFAAGWAGVAANLGLTVEVIPTDWRGPTDLRRIAAALSADVDHAIKAVLVVHNETSTGTTSDVAAVRQVMDERAHAALLLVDAVSSLGAFAVLHDEWRADVTIAASQKGLMLPPGLVLLAVSDKARAAKATARLPCAYWDWDPMLAACGTGSFPFTPATNLVAGLRVALDLFHDEGIDAVFARHRRLAGAVRGAVTHWGLPFVCTDPAARSDSVTAFVLPGGVSDSVVRACLLDRFGVTVGGGLGRLRERCLRVGHLGDVDELMVISVLAALEMGLPSLSVPLAPGGVQAAMTVLSAQRSEGVAGTLSPDPAPFAEKRTTANTGLPPRSPQILRRLHRRE